MVAIAFVAVTYGQTAVEHSVITAGSSAAGAKGVGSSIGGVFKKLNEKLDTTAKSGKAEKKVAIAARAKDPAPNSAPAAVPLMAPPQPVPAPKFTDPSDITEGLARADLIERFGEPLLRVMEASGSQPVERMWYQATKYRQIEVRLIDGKVASVHPPPVKKQN